MKYLKILNSSNHLDFFVIIQQVLILTNYNLTCFFNNRFLYNFTKCTHANCIFDMWLANIKEYDHLT